ncbi:glycoside hydrolase family 16 protein [Allobranchiibius sp. GilTou73]|uniref:glycoside hydrolase family 16 protein n=1 Tax=Allobranchiibius sp. GilTou73 TaxID=2904523 RepID=UPI001F48C582|nr:glycoside hydrolase family 16 protein [Allobranchiibius sp. GilTou73]UIJ34114.1 glycoside hydrolase family 16 protein [Allobranchiibius sp. GilTou73]
MRRIRAAWALAAVVLPMAIIPQSRATTPVSPVSPVNHYQKQVANLFFNRGDVPSGNLWVPTSDAGQLPAANPYRGRLATYPTGWGSPAAGVYHPETALSVSGGVLSITGKAVNGVVCGGNVEPVATDNPLGARTYGRVVYRMRATGASGFGFAALQWPSDDSGQFEFDHEGAMLPGTVDNGNYHYAYHDGSIGWRAAGGQQLSNWHTYQNDWWPGGMAFYIDGTQVFTTVGSGFPYPTIPMRWLVQLQRMWGNPPLVANSTATIQLAYVKEWAYNS